MSHRDAEELAAEIAYMQDDPSFRPKKDPLKDKGPNDLEAEIARWKFRNEQLHKHNQKITSELREVRKDNEKLAKEIEDKIKLLREKGVI